MSYDNVSLMNDVQEQSIDRLMELAPLLIAGLQGSDGAFGNVPLTRAQRIEQFLDDARMGAIDILQQQAPWRYTERVKQFRADMAVEVEHMNGAR